MTPAEAVDLWMSEAANYNLTNDRCKGVCGHYKQVVNCPTLRFSSTLVCNFAPGAGRARPYVEKSGATGPGTTQ